MLQTLPVFDGFFIGEDFIYYGFLRTAHGNILRAAVTPLNGIFFRPASVFWNLLFQSFLPHQPWFHHVRTYATTCLLTALVWALLGRVVQSWAARVAGLAFFALSKVHLTDIGYINCNDSVMSGIHLVCLLYFLLVHLQTGSRWSLWLSWIFFAMQSGSRDYGIVALAPVLLILLFETRRRGPSDWSRFTRLALPYFLIVLGYFGLRLAFVGRLPNGSGTVYALHFALVPFLYRAYLFCGNLLDLSLGPTETTGVGNFPNLLGRIVPAASVHAHLLDLAFFASAGLFFVGLVAYGLLKDRRLLVPLTLVVCYMVPTFLIQNIQIYYMLEALTGVSLAVAMAFDTVRAPRLAYGVWALILLVAGANAAVQSRAVRMLSWRFCADATERAYQATIRPNIGRPLDHWLLLVQDPHLRDFWSFNMTANDESPLVSVLMKNPGLSAHVSAPQPGALGNISDLSRDAAYIVENKQFLRVDRPVIQTVAISESEPGGGHIVKINGSNFLPSLTVLFNGSPVPTKWLNSGFLTATIPPASASGSIVIQNNPLDLRSNVAEIALERKAPQPRR